MENVGVPLPELIEVVKTRLRKLQYRPTRISILNINAITFGFSVPVSEQKTLLDIGEKCLHRLQEEYIILSYDNSEGAKVEIGDDFYLSFMPSESVLKVRLSTKYDWQFEDRMKKFSVMEFLKNMIDN